MNDTIEFRFKTRTHSVNGDYRVFGDYGSKIYPESEFKPIADKAGWEDGSCVVMYEERGKIYVAAFGLKRGTKDFSNRPIIFSFCQIFNGTTLDNWKRANAAFRRMILEWPEAEKTVRSLIKETPKKEGRGEDVSFKQDLFMNWLQEKKVETSNLSEIRHDKCENVSSLGNDIIFKPEGGCVLKWNLEEDEIYCFRNERNKSSSTDVDFSRKHGTRRSDIGFKGTNRGFKGSNKGIREGNKISGRKKIIWLSVALVVLALGTTWFVNHHRMNAAYAQAQETLKSVNQQIKQKDEEIKKLSGEVQSYEETFRKALSNASKKGFSEEAITFLDDAKEATIKGLEAKEKLQKARDDRKNLEAKKNDLQQTIVQKSAKNRDELEGKNTELSADVANLDKSIGEAQKASAETKRAVEELHGGNSNSSAETESK